MATGPGRRATTLLLTAVYLILTVGHAYSDNSGNNTPPPPPAAATLPPQGDEGGGGSAPAPLPSVHKTGRNLHKIFPDLDGNDTFLVPDIESYSNPQLYALLIDILEKLDVLVPRTPSCYQLQKIEHEVIQRAGDTSGSGSGSGSKSIGVYLYFSESPLTGGSGASPNSQSGGSAGGSPAAGGSNGSNGSLATPPVKANNGCVASEPDFVMSMDAQPLLLDGVANDTQGQGGAVVNGSGDAGAVRHTGPDGGGVYRASDNGEEEKGDGLGGLSRTQVVVISTCSAIICIFFIVAFILRVRNYIKRMREEQQQAQRPTFRSCSVRLRSVSHSNEQVRRDSQVSKLSHQSNVTSRGPGYSLTNGSTSRDHSNASSPHHDLDTKPLLLVTAAAETQPQNTLSVSQSSSLQFIDEEPRKKTSRSASQAMVVDDSEVKPLLTSSDLSANSLLLSPTSPTASGHPFSSSQNGGRSPFQPAGPAPQSAGPAPQRGPASRVVGGLPVHRGQAPGDGKTEAYYQKVSDSPSPRNGVLETAIEAAAAGGASGSGSSNIPAGAEDAKSGSAPDGNEAVQIPLIRFCGLTQSDSSMASVDGSRGYGYNYGTQTEYSPPPEVSYFSTVEYLNGMNSPYHALHLLHSPHPVCFSTHYSQPAPTNSTSVGDRELFPFKAPLASVGKKNGVGENIAPEKSSSKAESADCERATGCETSGFSNTAAAAVPGDPSAATVAADSVQNSVIPGAASSGSAASANSADSVELSEGSRAAPVPDADVCVGVTGDSAAQTPAHNEASVSLQSCGTEPRVGGDPDQTIVNAGKCVGSDCPSAPPETTGGDIPVKDRPSPCSAGEKIHPSSCTDAPSLATTADASPLPSALGARVRDSSDQSVTCSQSHDPSAGQPNASTESREAIVDQPQHSVGRSCGMDSSQGRASSSPSNAPGTTVVMKNLFSLDDERTTFL